MKNLEFLDRAHAILAGSQPLTKTSIKESKELFENAVNGGLFAKAARFRSMGAALYLVWTTTLMSVCETQMGLIDLRIAEIEPQILGRYGEHQAADTATEYRELLRARKHFSKRLDHLRESATLREVAQVA